MQYQPSSKVLFLTNCSLTKVPGGSAEYDEREAITYILPNSLRDGLIRRRAGIFQLVKNATDFHFKGVRVSDLLFNQGFTSGVDLGGDNTAAYMPALERYQGRFFKALGAEGKRQVVESGHHTLFLSGLYGLLRPMESIQLYSYPLEPPVVKRWRENDLLTEVLCEYIDRFSIARIIDLTAIDAYRQLIDWNKVAETKTDVLHCFDVMTAGESALVFFGECMADHLLALSEDEIVDLPSESQFGTVILRSLRETVTGLPFERIDAEKPLTGSQPADRKLAIDGHWQPKFERSFVKDLRSHISTEAMQAVIKVCENPITPYGNTIQPLKRNLSGKWRYRLGDLRIVYRPDRRKGWVVFESFESRGEAYKK